MRAEHQVIDVKVIVALGVSAAGEQVPFGSKRCPQEAPDGPFTAQASQPPTGPMLAENHWPNSLKTGGKAAAQEQLPGQLT
jgi:hypothetical protein